MRTKASRRAAWLSSAAALACAAAIPGWTAASAQAQGQGAAPVQAPADETAREAERIVVTAQRRAQDIQDVPIAITAVTSEQLVERGVTEVSDLADMAPNVTLDGGTPFSGSQGVLAAYIRGIGQNDFAFNLDPGVGVYLDGVYLARTVGANQDLLDVERVEILKGPQGTLFGRNTIGGAVSIITRDPGDEYAAQGEVTIGSFSRFDTGASIDIPLTDDLKSILSFSTHDRDGYQRIIPFPDLIDPVVGRPYDTPSFQAYRAAGHERSNTIGGDNTWNARYKIVFDNDSRFRATGSIDFTKTDSNGMPNTLLATTANVPGPFAVTPDRAVGIDTTGDGVPDAFSAVYNAASGLPPNGFLFAGLYNFCINSTPEQIAARNAQGVCGPTGTSINPSGVLPGFASVNVDTDPFNNRLPYDDRFITGNPDKTYVNGNNFEHLETGGVAGTLEYDLGGGHTVKSISAYRYMNWDVGLDFDGSPLNVNQVSFILNQWQASQELQLAGTISDNAIDYVVGFFYFKEQGDLHDYVTFSEGLTQIDGPNELSTENYAVFGQIDWHINDQFTLQLGGRYTEEDKTFEGFQSDLNGFNYKLFNIPVIAVDPTTSQVVPATIPEEIREAVGFPNPGQPLRYFPGPEQSRSFDNFSPRVGLQWFPADDLMLYFTYAEGYKTGGWTTRLSNPIPASLVDTTEFNEEKARSYEIGVKSRPTDWLQLNAAAFTTEYDDIQLNFQRSISPTIDNAGDAQIDGVELEAVADLDAYVQGLVLNASVGWLDTEYTEVAPETVVAPSVFQAGLFEGADLPKSPEWKINLAPSYRTELGNGGELRFLIDYTYQSSMWNDTERTFLIERPDINVVNASVTYGEPDGRWEVTVGGTNITDERYVVSGQAQIAGGQIVGSYNRPAEWYATLRTRF